MKHYTEMLDLIASPDVHSFGCLKCLFHAVQYGFRAHGVNCDPIMRKIGNDIGNSLSKNIVSQEPASILQEMLDFWEENEIGSFTVLENDPLNLPYTTFLTAALSPLKKKHYVRFAQGVFEGVFRAKMGEECVMQMLSKCNDNCGSCLFQMTKL